MERRKFTRIAGISNVLRLPRLGKIHLGRRHEEKGYPIKSDHFVVPEEVAAVYGPEPKELEVLLPCEDPGVFAAQARKCYAASKLWCSGDGEAALRATKDYQGLENVRLQNAEVDASLNGSITGDLSLKLIPHDTNLQSGDLVLTSGLGGGYPPDLIVGQVVNIRSRDYDLFQQATVQPVVDFNRLQIVLVIVNFKPVDISPLFPTP